MRQFTQRLRQPLAVDLFPRRSVRCLSHLQTPRAPLRPPRTSFVADRGAFYPVSAPNRRWQSSSSSNQDPSSGALSSSAGQQEPHPTAREPWRPAPHRNPNEPVYELYFTCKACKHRSGHTVSKQGYHRGTVLIKCDGCGNRHLISDHLKIFSDTPVTLKEILQDKGVNIHEGVVARDGDFEFWKEEAVRQSESGEKTWKDERP